MSTSELRLRTSVVLPTYNERQNIGVLIAGIDEQVDNLEEIIVVDDDSPDLTWRHVDALRERYPRLRLIRRQKERGLTSAIRAGIDASVGELVVWMDCDLSMRPEVISSLQEKIAQGYDVAVASRYVPGGADERDVHFHVLLSRIICTFARFLLVRSFRDYTSGFIAVRREVLDEIRLEGDYGEFFIDLIFNAFARGYRVGEVPYTLVSRASGESKTATNPLGFAIRGRKYVSTIVGLRMAALLRSKR